MEKDLPPLPVVQSVQYDENHADTTHRPNQVIMSSNDEHHVRPQSQSLSEGQQRSLQADEEKAELVPLTTDGPDGGVQGWLQVLVAFLLVLDGFGFITAFGVFQASYAKILPNSPSDISWIGSMQIFLLFLLGTLSGRLIDAGHFRITLITGIVFQVGGIFGASFSSKYWHFLLSQGIATGIGNGMHFTALVWLVSQYFTKRRGLALGISSCGAPIGAVIFTIIAREMIPRAGIQWTLRTMGFLVLADSIVIYLLARPKAATRKGGPLLELSAFKELPYLLFTIGMFFALLGVYFAYYYVPLFSRNKLNLDDSGALTVLIVMSAVGIIGRLIPPYLADKSIKPLRTLVISLLLSSLNVFAWIAVSSMTGLYVWVIAYAFTANAVQTLFTASMGEVTSDMSKLGVRIGMVFTIVSFACLAGPPIGGGLVGINHGNFLYAQIFAGASMLLGGLLVALAKIKQVGQKDFWRI
ncbi:major facilitator superfamily transporter [Colletotrichum orchidophilum]|uniref:Major facilitator superfamily transporter n=1 Tax=Colletotrichum orchidophilum TaxID=1209926 RepID=A0A1G4BGF5_9PEZI|nr:major facilitator superfamily transporter [Colletotrichum orchidophilum]OHF00436.1 major facilitator superfamily transporter [Colletotrichum orchidophilum]